MNDSSTGGTLPALPPFPADDDALDAILQGLVASITGLDGSLVRPRWQASVPKQPDPSVNWCALAVMSSTPDDGPWINYDPVSLTTLYYRHESLDVLVTFYGPQSKQYAAICRDGLAVNQNTEFLLAYAMRYVSTGPIRSNPEFINQQWIKRVDMSCVFRRKVTRVFAIQTIQIADIHLLDDTVVDATIVVPPGTPLES